MRKCDLSAGCLPRYSAYLSPPVTALAPMTVEFHAVKVDPALYAEVLNAKHS